LFFVLYGMLAAALLATLIWDAMFTDRADQEIVGVLPVRARTIAASRLAAMAAVGVAYSAAIAIPGGLMFSFVATTHPALGFLPVVFAAHVIATMLGCLFVLFSLLILRGLLALVLSDGATQGLATALQLIAVVSLVVVFFFLPAIGPTLVDGMLGGDARTLALPPVWFTALYSWMVGTDRASVAAAAQLGLSAFAASLLIVLPVYVMPARMLGRRTLEMLPHQRASAATSIARVIAPISSSAASVRSVLVFAILGVARSRRHMLMLATHLGFAIAIGMVDVLVAGYRRTLSWTEPHAYLLSLPLMLLFFAVLGLRAAFNVPIDLDANWPFRLKPPAVSAAVAATRAAMLAVGVVPVTVLTLLTALLAGWPSGTAAVVAVFTLLSGELLVECSLMGWVKVPLTCAHEPASRTLKSRVFLYAFALNLFAFAGANLQLRALQSGRAAVTYVAVVAVAIVILRSWRAVAQKDQRLEFDATDPGRLETLNLSEALH
jgi:hypothetical protein